MNTDLEGERRQSSAQGMGWVESIESLDGGLLW